jgi:hypothetical protein
MAGVEFNIEGGFTAKWNGQRFAVRQFKVWGGPTPSQICNEPQTITLDNGLTLDPLRSVWNGMYLDSYSASGVGAGIYLVSALYSTEEQRYKMQMGFQSETINIPYCIRGTTTLPTGFRSGTGNPLEDVYAWDLKQQAFLTTQSRMLVVVNYSRPSGTGIFQDVANIQARVNELHKPFNVDKWYRFEGGDAQLLGSTSLLPESRDYYQLSYSWACEAGLELPATWNGGEPSDAAGGIKFPDSGINRLPGGATTPDMLLPPYHRFVPFKLIDDPAGPYRFTTVLPFFPNANGWASLPGLS